MVSLIMLSADCEDLKAFVLWHLVWFVIMMFSIVMIGNVEGKEE